MLQPLFKHANKNPTHTVERYERVDGSQYVLKDKKATNTKDGIRMHLNSEEEYKVAARKLEGEKITRMVIKRVLEYIYITMENLKDMLKENNIRTTKVIRLIHTVQGSTKKNGNCPDEEDSGKQKDILATEN